MPSFEPDIHESRGRRDLVVPLVFLVLSLLLLVLPAAAQQQLSLVLRGSVLAPFLTVQESLNQTRIRASSIRDLQLQFDSAIAELHSQTTLAEENDRLRALLELRARGGPDFVSASAIRAGTQGSESMFILNVGSSDGVTVNAPVVVAGGLVGVVREVGPTSALAMDWTNPDFRVSGMTVDGAVLGIVEPRQGAFREEDRLILMGVPYHTSVDLGTEVVTSGRGSVYPRGIPVGTIQSLGETEEGWHRSYWLEPTVRPGSATHVLVFTGPRDAAESTIERLWAPDSTWVDTVPDDESLPEPPDEPPATSAPVGGTP